MAGPKVEAALAALQSGEQIPADIAESVGEPEQIESNVEEVQAEVEPEVEATEDEAISPNSQEVSQDVDASDEVEETEVGDTEEIVVNGKTFTIDYSDKDKLRTYAKQAGGFRKMQAERDELAKWKKSVESDYSELKNFEDTIETAYADGHIRGVAELLAGSQQAYKDWLNQEVEKEIAKRDASPAELERIELQERLDSERREREKLVKQQQREQEKRQAESERLETEKLQNQLDRGFNKWNFAGKLGDQELEQSINEMVWEKAKAEIGELPDDHKLTQADVDKAFRKAANSFRKFSKSEGRKVASQTMENTKKQAASKAAMLASKGVGVSQVNDDVKSKIKTGDIRGSFYSFLDKMK